MTNEIYRIGNYRADPSTFGGVIYYGDFDGYHSLSDIASRIVSDLRFDQRRKREAMCRNKYKNNTNGDDK